MSGFQRGVVKRVTFEIEYPDGSSKTEDVDDPENIALIALAEEHVGNDDSSLFNVSESDWKENPAMMVYKKNEVHGIPFCTHNGCS